MSEETKMKIGTVLVFFQILLLAVVFWFNAACDAQLEKDGVVIEDLLK